MAMLAALAAVAGLFALQGPPPAAAHGDYDGTEEHLDIDCPDDPVGEGNSYWIDVLNEHGPQGDDWFENEAIKVYWYTFAETADKSDYQHLYAEGQISNGWQSRHGKMGREFFTKEDDYPELEETYRVWGNNYHDDGDDVECEITIRDDDGYGVYETEITSTPADGHTYRAGEVIEITMQHNTPVVVQDQVGIAIRVGDAEGSYRFARHHTGSGTDTLTYRHEVEPDDFDDDGISVDAGTSGSGFGGDGSVRVENSNGEPADPINQHYRGLEDQSGHKVDGTVRVTDVELVSTPASGGTYRKGEEIEIDVTFNAPVDALNRPAVSLWVDGTGESVWKPARYKSGTGTKTLRFARQVAPADRDADGLTIGAADSDGLGEGKVRAAGTDIDAVHSYRAQRNLSGHRVDGWPYVTDRQLTSAPAQGDTYRKGETIAVTVTFDQEVDVEGEVLAGLQVGDQYRQASYASGSGSDSIVFEYVVKPEDP